MEGGMVDGMVEEVGDGGGEKWREVAGQGTWAAVFLVAYVSVGGRRKKCKGEDETKRGVVIYIGERNYIIIPCFHSKWRFKVAFHSKWRPRLAVGLSC